MSTHLSSRLPLPAGADAAFALVTDPGYVERVALATGGQDVAVEVTQREDGGAVVVSTRSLPADLPSYARALVGDSVRLTETRTFGPAAADGSRDGTVSVDFGSAPVQVTGTLRLATEGTGSAVAIEMDIASSVPFVGGKVERFCAEQVERFVAKEQEVAAG